MCRWKAKAGPRFGMEKIDVMEKWKKKEKKSHFTSRVFQHKWTTFTPGPLAEAHNSLHSYANR